MKTQRTLPLLATLLVLCACTRPAVETIAIEPPLESMKMATPAHGKIGVPVDVRYQVTGVVAKDQPATLQLAFVPRVEGEGLRVEFPESKTVAISTGSGDLSMQRAQAAEPYRRSLNITPLTAEGAEIQVIVSMDIAGGRYFSVFTIPVESSAPPP
jgi:hypothetical protein